MKNSECILETTRFFYSFIFAIGVLLKACLPSELVLQRPVV